MKISDNENFMGFARQASTKSSCIRRKVGAVIVIDKRIVATGYNGTPSRTTDCDEGGCPRCASLTQSGSGLEMCLCVHAEQNAIAQAARLGPFVEGGTLYGTHQPCFNCLTLIIQAGLRRVMYRHSYLPDSKSIADTYARLCEQARLDVVQYAPLAPRVENGA